MYSCLTGARAKLIYGVGGWRIWATVGRSLSLKNLTRLVKGSGCGFTPTRLIPNGADTPSAGEVQYGITLSRIRRACSTLQGNWCRAGAIRRGVKRHQGVAHLLTGGEAGPVAFGAQSHSSYSLRSGATINCAPVSSWTSCAVHPGATSFRTRPSGVGCITARSVTISDTQPLPVTG